MLKTNLFFLILFLFYIPLDSFSYQDHSKFDNLSPQSFVSETSFQKNIIPYMKEKLRKYNVSSLDKSLSLFQQSKTEKLNEIENLLKQTDWDFKQDDYKTYDWYRGLNLMIGIKGNTLKILSSDNKQGKDYGVHGINTVSHFNEQTDWYLMTLIEEISKEEIIADYIKNLKTKYSLNEFLNKWIGFIQAENTGENYRDKLWKIFFKNTDKDKILEALIFTSKDKIQEIRHEAVRGLAMTEDAKATEALILALEDKDTEVQYSAVRALGQIGSEKATEALISVLTSNNKKTLVQLEAAKKLGQTGNEKTTGALISVLTSKSISLSVQKEIAEILGKTGNEKATEALIPLLTSGGVYPVPLKRAAAEALGQLGSQKAIDTLILALKDENPEVQFSVVRALGEIGNEKTTAILVSILDLKDLDYRVQAQALWELGQTGDEKLTDRLILALRDKRYEIQSEAAQALGQMRNEKAMEALILAFKKTDLRLQRKIAWILGQMGNERATEALILALKNNPNPDLQHTLVRALGQTGNEKATEALIPVLKHKNLNLQLEAVKALMKTGTERATEALILTLEDKKNPDLQLEAARALMQIGNKKAADALFLIFKETTNSDLYYLALKALRKIRNKNFLLSSKTKVDWKHFGISSEDISKGFLTTRDKPLYKKVIEELVGKEGLSYLDSSWDSSSPIYKEEKFLKLKTNDMGLIEEGIDLIYGYLYDIKFNSDVQLGEEYEIINRTSVPEEYYKIFPNGNDENEIITYPSHPLYQKIFSRHIPSNGAGVHRTVEQKVDRMDAKLITTFCQLYSLGMDKKNIFIGKEINPQDSSMDMWEIRYNEDVKKSFGEAKPLFQSTDWNTAMSGSLMWYFMNYADKFPLKWERLRSVLLEKLSLYEVNIYDYEASGEEVRVPTQKTNESGDLYQICKYQYDLTKVPLGKKDCVMRLIINDPEVVNRITQMILEVTEHLLQERKELKQLMAYEALKEVYSVVARGEIPDEFAHYRILKAKTDALEKIVNVFTDSQENSWEKEQSLISRAA